MADRPAPTRPAGEPFAHRERVQVSQPRLGNAVADALLDRGCQFLLAFWPSGLLAGSRAEVVLSFDGSFNGDTTVLVVATVDQQPHIDLVELWEPAGRQVPVVDVEAAIRLGR